MAFCVADVCFKMKQRAQAAVERTGQQVGQHLQQTKPQKIYKNRYIYIALQPLKTGSCKDHFLKSWF